MRPPTQLPVRPTGASRRRAAVPLALRRRRRSHGGPLVFGALFLAAFIGVAFLVGWLVGRMLI